MLELRSSRPVRVLDQARRAIASTRPLRAGRRLAVATSVAAAAAIGPGAAAQCQLQLLEPQDNQAGDQFGDSVAVDVGWMLVGSSRDDAPFDGMGSVTVFRDEGLGWISYEKIVAPDGAADDFFGWSVDLDVDAPGGPVAVVGAYLADTVGANTGAAYVFRLVGDEMPTWVHQATLTPDDGMPGDQFGISVAVDDDVIAVGALRADGIDTDTGAVYVFEPEGGGWGPPTRLEHPTAAAQDRLGASVAIEADGPTGWVLAVGSALDDVDGLVNAGSVVVFRHDGSSWDAGEVVTDTMSGMSAGDNFGQSVDLENGVLLVGIPLDDAGASNTGSAVIFRDLGGWTFETRLLAADGAADDQLGRSVGLDRAGMIAVCGAPQADSAGANAGAGYLFLDNGAFWEAADARLLALDAEPSDQFGSSVAASINAVAVGARAADNPGSNSGAAYTFTPTFETCDDCNGNFIADVIEILQDPALDCDEDGVLDVCQIAFDSPATGGPYFCEESCDPDCNDNGVPDICDITSGASDDLDGNLVPDECEDCNGNGVPDTIDLDDQTSLDCNENGVPDECDIDDGLEFDCNLNGIPDVCDIASGMSEDCDENGEPDECDDCNGNGVADSCDIDPADPDGDGIVIPDLDGDGIPDDCQDCNQNGLPDFIDLVVNPDWDCNGNDVIDVCEIDIDSDATPPPGQFFWCTEGCDPDCNDNGIPDECDIASGFAQDIDGNGVPDDCEDCNENGVPDGLDVGNTSLDCDGNGVPDECQIPVDSPAPGTWYCLEDCDIDCNQNGIPDACDIADGLVPDCDGNGVPDDCDPDCNDNGVPDGCDIVDGTSADFDGNGVPDECDPDCDGDGVTDFIEILFGLETDCNENGIPDACDIDPTDPDGDGFVFPDGNGNGLPDICDEVVGDVNGDAVVNFTDLLIVLSNWGSCGGGPCPADLDLDGMVGFLDLLTVLSNWT